MKKKGFTLIEVILAIAILSIAMIGISYTITVNSKIRQKTQSQFNLNNYTKSTLDYLKAHKDLKTSVPLSKVIYFSNGTDLNQKLSQIKSLPAQDTSLNFKLTIDIQTTTVDTVSVYKIAVRLYDARQNKEITKCIYVNWGV